MQSIQFPIKKNSWLLLPLAITIFALFSITSCKEKKVNFAEALTDTEFPCVVLTYKNVTGAWTEAELASIAYFTFFTNYDLSTETYSAYVQANNASHNQIGSFVKLDNVAGCNKKLGFVAVGRNNIDMNKLGIFISGKLQNFDNIKLTPDVYTYRGSDFLNFHVEIITGGVARPVPDDAFPCPPCINCRPPCKEEPYDTITNDNPIIDTTGG